MDAVRIKKLIDKYDMIKMNKPQKLDFENMPPELLDDYVFRGLQGEIKAIKNICNYEGISLKDRQGFTQGLRIYREKYCNDEMREFYSDGLIELLGNLYDEHKDKLNLE